MRVQYRILFVSAPGAGSSLMAAAYTAALSGGAVQVRCAGMTPACPFNGHVVRAMAEQGIDITAYTPTELSAEAIRTSQLVVAIGRDDALTHLSGPWCENWDLPDPADLDVDAVRLVRDEIRARVLALLHDLRIEAVAG